LQHRYNVAVANRFDCLESTPDDVDKDWTSFCNVIRSCADEVVGPQKNVRQPWLSDATYKVLQDNAAAKLRNDTVQRKRLQGLFNSKAKADRNAYYSRIASEVEEDIQCNCMGSVYKTIRILAGKVSTPSSHHILKTDGNLCTSQTMKP